MKRPRVPIVISFFTEHVNWDANDSKIFITHSKQEGLSVVVHVLGNEPLLVGNGQEQNS